MDNAPPKNTTSSSKGPHDSTVSITLTPTQFSIYQKAFIEIQAPDGSHLEHVGNIIKNEKNENNLFRTREQLSLVTCLLGNISDSLDLPTAAVMGLASLLFRAQEICDNYTS